MTIHAPNEPIKTPEQHKIHRIQVQWTTFTYKTVAIYAMIVGLLVLGGVYFAMPSWYSAVVDKVSSAVGTGSSDASPLDQKQARFVNLDGKVQIKKVNSVQWVDANFRSTLDKGDLVQTASDGAARITFADGTTYTVKADTLVTVEENSMGRDRPTSVAVRISTGAVDLATPNWSSPDSRAAVSVEDATASLSPNSHAAVTSDPATKEHEITVQSGTANVQRGEEHIELTQWEKASFPTGGPVQKTNVLAPPELAEPLNLQPLIVDDPKKASVHFEWKPVAEAVSYTLRVSTTSMFTKSVAEKKGVAGTSTDVSGLDAGDYFWNVVGVDAKKRTSEVSETFKFTLVAQAKSQDMVLEVDGTQIHGRVVEIYGHTEQGAALIVNGQSVANIAADGKFRHFTEPLDPGQHTIVIIGSNRRGGTAKQQFSIVIPK